MQCFAIAGVASILWLVAGYTLAFATGSAWIGDFSKLMVVYVPVTHWVRSGGWLQQMGLYGFAGGTVVHMTAGVAALVLGPRRGFPTTAMPLHNMTMTVTGAGML